MDSKEATDVLDLVMAQYRQKDWAELRRLVEERFALQNTHYETVGASSGRSYQVRVNVFWDDKEREHLRVKGSVDDGGWRAMVPLTRSFIVDPAGHLIGE